MSSMKSFSATRGLQLLGRAASYLLLLLSVLAAAVLIVVPMLTGSQTYTVLTNSMAPAYPPGTLLVVKPTNFDELSTGDVITYQLDSGRPEVITHRVVSTSVGQFGERLLATQGDNNDLPDPDPVMEVQVRGELLYAVPYVGYLANLLGQAQRGWVVTVIALGLIVFGLISIVRGLLTRKDTEVAPEEGAGSEATPKAETAEDRMVRS